jgi:hypothetical protein
MTGLEGEPRHDVADRDTPDLIPEVSQPADHVHSEQVQDHDDNGEPEKPDDDFHEPRAARGVVERKSG